MGTRGELRIYLGAAPGVGKTYAMLGEARRRAGRGADVVVGYVETHGRVHTAEQIGDLETVPRRALTYRGCEFTELDVDAVIARRPQVALVDELAHTNVPGSRNGKRWQDVEEILDAGIDVISTVNIQHLESMNDVVERITGARQRETVPDEVVRRAAQVELIDMTPEALRRRMAHGNVYAPEKIDAALANYFRPGNLTALRELALLWLADKVDEALERYRDQHGITEPWEARERIVVGLTGGPEGDTLIRRAARIAARAGRADLLAVHVARADGLASGASGRDLARQRALVEGLGGSYHQVLGDDAAAALLEFTRGVNATQLVLGSSRRRGWQFVFGPGVGATVARESSDIDVHLVTHEHVGKGRGLVSLAGSPLSVRRRTAGWVLALLGPPALVVLLDRGERPGLATDLMLFLALTVVVALAGGLWPAILAAVLGFLAVNWYFTPPLHTLTIAEPRNALGLLVFVAVAVAVSSVVDLAARRTRQAARSGAEAETLSLLATSVLRGENALPALLERVRETFGVRAVALLERTPDGWRTRGAVGADPAAHPDDAEVTAEVGGEPGTPTASATGSATGSAADGATGSAADGATGSAGGGVTGSATGRVMGGATGGATVLALSGRVLPASDRRVLSAFASQAGAVLEWRRLAEEAARARRLEEGDEIRTALLAAVSHDLRTPLASIKAGVSSLRATDVQWDPEDEAELLASVEESADRLDGLIGNLLDMSRLQTGVVTPIVRPVALDEVLPRALLNVPPDRVRLDVPETLPPVAADPGLLERALANVVENAVRHSREPVLVTAGELRFGREPDRVDVRVVDRGPGVPDAVKDRMFAPFQRLGDAPKGNGVGLGLAVARGFVAAIGGTLTPEDTPGGGLTMVFGLPLARGGPGMGEDRGQDGDRGRGEDDRQDEREDRT
ncbi:sensor histidine kinase [Actinomadura gamaensis]|uniref:histidine kinase n=1 Tax=Actinomadura gamaensis TaxID=1763541 RepID=A0ABV9UBQ5_9ACTN